MNSPNRSRTNQDVSPCVERVSKDMGSPNGIHPADFVVSPFLPVLLTLPHPHPHTGPPGGSRESRLAAAFRIPQGEGDGAVPAQRGARFPFIRIRPVSQAPPCRR